MIEIERTEVAWAKSADIPEAVAVFHEITEFRAGIGQDRWQKDWFTTASLQDWIDRGELVIARYDGRLVGAMLIQAVDHIFWPDDPPGEALYVHRLARSRLAPEAKGLAPHLLAFAENAARAAGRPYLRLDCAVEPKLCAIYERIGFTRLDLWEVSPDFISVRWEKRV